MNVQTTPGGITFSVHKVERATSPLPTHKTHLALKSLLGSGVESCSDFTAECVRRVEFHPLLAAAHLAFSQHRPLVLSPDMIWVAIVQGVAHHVRNHGERLRHRFVGHEGRLEIRVDRSGFHKGSPENAWGSVIGDLSRAIRGHLGETYDRLVADFGTTGAVERTACEVALLDVFQPYFEYRMVCVCGIPAVSLEGTTDDWNRLRGKVEHLAPYDLDWWLPAVRSACDQFVRASAGDIDLPHWRDAYKREEAYGWDAVNGWLVTLVPYLKNGQSGNFSVRNPLLGDPGARVTTDELPGGVSLVPFRCRWRGQAEDDAMEFLGGFLGVTQDPSTLALRPKLGWAVRRGTALDLSLARLSGHDPAPPLDASEFDRLIGKLTSGVICELPGDFLLFYKRCDGVLLPGVGGDAFHRFRDLGSVETVEGLRTERPADRPGNFEPVQAPWVRFCDLADGTFLALELSQTYEKGWKVARGGTIAAASTGLSPIVAWSFEEVLRRALDGEGLDSPPGAS